MGEEFNIVDFNKQAKKIKRKKKREERWNKILNWCKNNPEYTALFLSTASGIVVFVVKGVVSITKQTIKTKNLKKEEDLKNLYCYDRSLGHYWSLKRELTNAEWLAIDERKKNGERLSDILKDLNVLNGLKQD